VKSDEDGDLNLSRLAWLEPQVESDDRLLLAVVILAMVVVLRV